MTDHNYQMNTILFIGSYAVRNYCGKFLFLVILIVIATLIILAVLTALLLQEVLLA